MTDPDAPTDEGLDAGAPNVLFLPGEVYLAEGLFSPEGDQDEINPGRFLIVKAQFRENGEDMSAAETKHLMFDIGAGKVLVEALIKALNADHEMTLRERGNRG